MRVFVLACLVALIAPVSAQSFDTGLSLTLPDDWTGTEEVDEGSLPQTASYRFVNTNPESDWLGAVVHVERVTGLNPMMRERWMQGRVPFGYHGAQPVAAVSRASVPFPNAVGIQTTRDDRPGAVYFLATGQTYWAVQVEVPASMLEAQPDALAVLARAVRFNAGS